MSAPRSHVFKQASEAPTHPPPSRIRLALWLVTAFLAGAVIMTLELVAFRLYAPYFGYSIYVWGSMISVVMAALAGGYALGGWVADRSRTDLPLYSAILSSAIYQLVIAWTVRSFLPSLAQRGEFIGTALATVLIFTPPMTALAMAGPFLVRLLARAGHIGSTAGKVYALSTIGGSVGILATSFFLVPRFGTQATLGVACATSALLGVAGLTASRRVALLALVPMAALPYAPGARWPKDTVWVGESAYNLVRVVRQGSRLLLVVNDEGSVHTIRDEATGWTGRYYDDFALGPLLVRARRALVLGMGAGGSITSTRATAPDIEIEAVEIDRTVVETGVRFFGLRPEEGRLRIHVADARPWLARDRGSYEIVHVDLYQGGPYLPFYLITVEFFHLVRARLSGDGVLMMNVFDASKNFELLFATAATLGRVFPSLAVLSREHGNHIVFAFPRERSAASIRAQLERVEGPEPIRQLARNAASAVVDLVPPAGTPVFTDDHAPVEEMTRRMLAEYRGRAQGVRPGRQ